MNTHPSTTYATELPLNINKKMKWLLSEIFYLDDEYEPIIIPKDRPILEKYLTIEKI